MHGSRKGFGRFWAQSKPSRPTGGGASLLAAMALAALLSLAMGPAADASIVVINEIMYHPSDSQGDIEYLELYNDTPLAIDLGGWYFSAGIKYTFPDGTWIPSHGYIVLASSPTLVQAAYPSATVMGPYSGRLSNAGERVELRNANGGLIDYVSYNDRDPWPVAADGTGHSLSLIDPDLLNNEAESWTWSSTIGGTPGAENFPSPPPASSVVINEVCPNPATGDSWLELHNPTGGSVDISGWYLSNNRNTLNMYQIPAGTVLPADGYVVFTSSTLGFSLKPTGGRVFLTNASLTRVMDAVDYEETGVGHSRGRYFDRRNHKEHWYYMTSPTSGSANTVAINDSVVINEIMYHPFPGRPNHEYVELYNRGSSPVDLTGWRFTNGIRYKFTSGTVLAAGAYLVVAESTSTIVSVYGLPASQVVGNFKRNLNDDRDHVVLRDNWGNIADEVRYFDGGRWPEWADGMGSSLELIDPDQSNDYPSAWAASDDSSKSQWTYIEYTKPQISGAPFESEFQMMLLDDGIILVDDLHMIPAGGGSELIPNGGFESGTSGWVIDGTHKHSEVVTGAGNVHSGTRALKVVAVGRGTESVDHIECDTNSGLTGGADYTISYWAKWIVGCNQFLTRTHFHGVAQTNPIPVPERLGTPGQQNSRYQANLGPIIAEVHHSPVTPNSSQQVTITALVLDSDGVSDVRLYYKADTAGAFTNLVMYDDGAHGDGAAGDDVYGIQVPAMADDTLVEFYIRAIDSLGAWQTFPASDPPSTPPPKRALYRVRNGSRGTSLKVFELLINDDVVQELSHRSRMDNELLDATFTLNDKYAFYNVRFRYKGSGYTRPSGLASRPQYRIRFNSDQSLFGLISVNVDNLAAKSANGAHNRLVQWIMYKLGGVPTSWGEYIRMFRHCSSDPDRNHGVYEHQKRVDKAFVDEYFPDGNNGFLHKVDDHFEWSDDGSRTRRHPDDTARLKYYGPDEELYRWNFKPRTREIEDDFTSLIAMIRFMDPDQTDDSTWLAGVESVIDTHEWLKKLATSAVCDDWDTLGMEHGGDPRGKNCYLYKRSDDGRWVLIPWDHDLTLSYCQRGVIPSWWFDSCHRLMTVGPYGRWYLRYIKQIIDGPMSQAQWDAEVDRIAALLQAEESSLVNPSQLKSFANCRRDWLRNNVLPGSIAFEITTNNGNDFAVDTTTVTLQGTGGLDIMYFKVNGVATSDSTWLDSRTWQISNIPLHNGANPLTVVAYDDDWTTVGIDTITVTVYPNLRTIPYGTSFEPTEAPPFVLGPLPQNLWEGYGDIQDTEVYEGVQAVGVQNGWVEHEFFGEGHNVVWIQTFIRTSGTTELPQIATDQAPFATQLFFSRTLGIMALNGNGAGGGNWVATSIACDPNRFIRIAIRLDFTAQQWDLYIEGNPVLTGLGFAYPVDHLSKFRYYSDVYGAMDKFSVTTTGPGMSGLDIKYWRLY